MTIVELNSEKWTNGEKVKLFLKHRAGAVQSKKRPHCVYVLNANWKSKPHWNIKKGQKSQSSPFILKSIQPLTELSDMSDPSSFQMV